MKEHVGAGEKPLIDLKPKLVYQYQAKFVRAVDGDSYEMELKLPFFLKYEPVFRLNRIDTPELHSKDQAKRERARKAQAFVITELTGQPLLVESHLREKYGRPLAEVWYSRKGEIVNMSDLLLSQGLADPYSGGKRA